MPPPKALQQQFQELSSGRHDIVADFIESRLRANVDTPGRAFATERVGQYFQDAELAFDDDEEEGAALAAGGLDGRKCGGSAGGIADGTVPLGRPRGCGKDSGAVWRPLQGLALLLDGEHDRLAEGSDDLFLFDACPRLSLKQSFMRTKLAIHGVFTDLVHAPSSQTCALHAIASQDAALDEGSGRVLADVAATDPHGAVTVLFRDSAKEGSVPVLRELRFRLVAGPDHAAGTSALMQAHHVALGCLEGCTVETKCTALSVFDDGLWALLVNGTTGAGGLATCQLLIVPSPFTAENCTRIAAVQLPRCPPCPLSEMAQLPTGPAPLVEPSPAACRLDDYAGARVLAVSRERKVGAVLAPNGRRVVFLDLGDDEDEAECDDGVTGAEAMDTANDPAAGGGGGGESN